MKAPFIFSEFSPPLLFNEKGIHTLISKDSKRKSFTEEMTPTEIAEIISNRLIEMVKKQLFAMSENPITERINAE